MRKYYLDNIRWITVIIVVIYHVFYMYNAEGVLGGLGRIFIWLWSVCHYFKNSVFQMGSIGN